jgi:glycerol kinase
MFSEPVEHLPPERIAMLLQEGIVFRVARILEDFQREFGIERVYLSGGLSGLPCLQQGIAQCVPLAAYRLPQADASMLGAALLAAGMPCAGVRAAEKINVFQPAYGLCAKYVRWKDWLDGLLRTRPLRQGG